MKLLIDTGASMHILGKDQAEKYDLQIESDDESISVNTASGQEDSSDRAELFLDCLDCSIRPWILNKCPGLVSVGSLCLEQDVSFVWPRNRPPYFYGKDGRVIDLDVHSNIPILKGTSVSRAPNAKERAVHHALELLVDSGEYGEGGGVIRAMTVKEQNDEDGDHVNSGGASSSDIRSNPASTPRPKHKPKRPTTRRSNARSYLRRLPIFRDMDAANRRRRLTNLRLRQPYNKRQSAAGVSHREGPTTTVRDREEPSAGVRHREGPSTTVGDREEPSARVRHREGPPTTV